MNALPIEPGEHVEGRWTLTVEADARVGAAVLTVKTPDGRAQTWVFAHDGRKIEAGIYLQAQAEMDRLGAPGMRPPEPAGATDPRET